LDIPRIFNITESAHRIHNPITPEKLATLGAALRLEAGDRVLDLGSGSGEMLCTWARDHGISGTGIDMSALYTEQAKRRAEELGVADQVRFIHGDAAGYVSDEKVSVAACVGASWSGMVTISARARSTRSCTTWREMACCKPKSRWSAARCASITWPQLRAGRRWQPRWRRCVSW
jgi:SAM-dependent methyltransferase